MLNPIRDGSESSDKRLGGSNLERRQVGWIISTQWHLSATIIDAQRESFRVEINLDLDSLRFSSFKRNLIKNFLFHKKIRYGKSSLRFFQFRPFRPRITNGQAGTSDSSDQGWNTLRPCVESWRGLAAVTFGPMIIPSNPSTPREGFPARSCLVSRN